jgi:hypothetical protein
MQKGADRIVFRFEIKKFTRYPRCRRAPNYRVPSPLGSNATTGKNAMAAIT